MVMRGREIAQVSKIEKVARQGGRLLVVASFAVALLAGLGLGEIPQKINYQGKLVDGATGTPLAGSHSVTFKLYDAAAGGDTLWTESQVVSADSAGVMSCLLGTYKPITASFEGPRWLEVEVDGEALQPRRELASVPYAFLAQGSVHASRADSLGGKSADGFADASHSHDDRYYTEAELNSSGTINQAGNPVDWTELKNVPAGLADGIDEVGAGDGYSLDAADGDPADVVYVDNAGNVGIGTTTPARELHVAGVGPRVLVEASTGNPEVNFKLGGDSSPQVWALYKESITGDLRFFQDGDRVTIKNGTGAVGIGTTSPVAPLDVVGAINTGSAYMLDGKPIVRRTADGSLFVGLAAGANNAGDDVVCLGDSAAYNNSGSDNTFIGRSAGFNNQGLGNVFVGMKAGYANTEGIANTYLGAEAGMANTTGEANTYVGTQAGRFATGSSNTCVGAVAADHGLTGSYNVIIGRHAGSHATGSENVFIGGRAGYTATGSNNVFIGEGAGFSETGSNKLHIATGFNGQNLLIYGDFSTGRIGLGTSAPERKVHIVGDAPRVLIEASAGNPEVNFKTAGDAASEIWAIYKHETAEDLRFYQNGDRLTIQNSTGNVGIGTTNPAGYKLYVNGEAWTTVSWSSSDARLKKDLLPIGDALSKVLRLRGLSFLWRTEEYPDRGLPGGRHYGLIAQDVAQVLPEVVKEGSDGEKAVAYSEVIPILVESMRELKAETDELRAESQALRAANEALRARLDAMEASAD